MKNKFTLMGRIFPALLVLLAVLLGGCVSEKEVTQEVLRANYCTVDSDCVLVNFGCPFNCGSYVNKGTDIERLSGLVSDYLSTATNCIPSCPPFVSPACSNGKCVPDTCKFKRDYGMIAAAGTSALPCVCPANSKSSETANGMFQCIPEPDFSGMASGEKVLFTVDLRQEPDLGGQFLTAQCRLYDKANQKEAVLTVFNDLRYDRPMQVCYKKNIDCNSIVAISGELKKFEAPCWEFPSEGEEQRCAYLAINADDISCPGE